MPPIVDAMNELLDLAIANNASDLHLTVDVPPSIRVDGRLMPLAGKAILQNTEAESLIFSLMSSEQRQRFDQQHELDFGFSYKDKRLRANVFRQKNNLSAALRLIPMTIKTAEQLGVPKTLLQLTEHSQGFVVITGPTGHGKSSTLAALIDHINQTRASHIITIEDPIEYLFEQKKSIIEQREVGSDTDSFARALKSALREDPNVILIGEMRDLETIEAALTLAETGHLVFTTLHTNSASQTADRIIDVFPPHQQQQVRLQLSNVLLGVVSQRLLPLISGGRVLALEYMLANSAIRNTIREGKTHQLPNIIHTSSQEGMISLDKSLADLVHQKKITLDTALQWALDPKELMMMLK